MTDEQVKDIIGDKVAVSSVVTPGPGSMSLRQWLYGLFYTVVSAVVPIAIESFANKTFTLDWKTIGTVSAGVAFTYLLSNLPRPTQQTITFKKP